MSKKKLLAKGVAFSILVPFSCGIILPTVEAVAGDKPVVYAETSTYNGSLDDVEFNFANSAVCMSSDCEVSDFGISTMSAVSAISSIDMVFSKVNLNVRSSPSTSSSIVGLMAKGEAAVLVSESNGWYKIEYNGGYAYVSANSSYTYVETISASNKVVESLVNLNVRTSASTSASKVGMLYAGDTAVYLETVGSWHKIIFDGGIAYVSASTSYCKIVESESDSSGSVVTPESEDNSNSGSSSGQTESATGQVVTIATSGLNVRSGASTSSAVYAVAGYGESYEYLATSGSWYKINYNGTTAYVSASYCTLKDASSAGAESSSDCDILIMSCVSSLNVRSAPSTSSTCVGSLDKGDMVSFVDLENGWYETVYKGSTAYVSASDIYTSLAYFETGSEEVEDVIDLGYTLLGTPYVYGATRYLNYDGSLNSYFTGNSYDCSSMVQYIYASTLGIELGSTSREQSLDGVEVAVSDIKRGDLLFFTNSDRYYNTGIERIGHVAIYLGNNYILHTASDYAVIEEISATRWSYFITARDVIASD
ncbi:MAG: SH3 domain-containing protein [Bacillota bacterium]